MNIKTKKDIEYKYGNWNEHAESVDWRKYFRAVKRAYIGAVGDGVKEYDKLQFRKLDLTTKLGVKNTFEDMRNDFKKLNRWLSKMGLDLDYYAIPEISPDNGLVHLHCIYRANDIDVLCNNKYFPSAKEVSEKWEELHGAKIIKFDEVWDNGKQAWISYMAKHIGKEYPTTSKLGFRMLTSKNWLPSNCELVERAIRKHINGLIARDGEAKESWSQSDKLMYQWAGGKAINLLLNTRVIVLKGQKIFENVNKYDLRSWLAVNVFQNLVIK